MMFHHLMQTLPARIDITPKIRLLIFQRPHLCLARIPHGEKQDKTAASDYKNDCYKYLIYSQYILTNEETGYWRLVLIGVNLYHSCTSPEGSHGSISFQQRATAFNSVQINFFDDGPSK